MLACWDATVTSMLQRLEEAGLATRQRDPEDNRLVRVRLTEAGYQKERSINEQFGKMQELIFKGINEEERAFYRRRTDQLELTHQGIRKEKNESSTN